MRVIFYFAVVFCTFQGLLAQPTVDSLTTLLKHHQHDTFKVSLLTEISSLIWGEDPEKAKDHALQALNIAEGLHYTKGLADAHRELSRYYWSQTEYDKSTAHALLAIKEYEKISDMKGISWCYSVIGSNYSQANNYERALHYHNLALHLNTQIDNKSGIARNLNSIGYIHELKKEYYPAREFYQKALTLRLIESTKEDLTISYANVGSIHFFIEDYPVALEYLFKALALALEINNKNYIALIYQNIGEVYYKTGNHKDGEQYLAHALRVAHEIGDKKRKEGVYEALKSLEESRQNYRAAFHYLVLLQGIRDTLYTQDRSRQMAKMEALYETEKKEQTIKLLEQEKQIQTLWRNTLSLGIVLISIVTLVIYKLQRSRTQKAKELLDIQQALNDKLKEIDQTKSRFFANISHEFRTPLTLILAPLEERLSSLTLPHADKETLLIMHRNAVRLLDLVNQLLDLSKLEAGKMLLYVKQGNLYEFVNVLTTAFDSLAGSRKVHFKKNIALPAQEYWFDCDVLEKILTNLLSNAFKFTPAEGIVTFTIQTKSDPAIQGIMLIIEVSDTGKGIPKDEQAHIFSPFYRALNTSTNLYEGTGLGLSIVKELVKLYEGSIELESEENAGTTITVCIPAGNGNFREEQKQSSYATESRSGLNSRRDNILSQVNVPEDEKEAEETEDEVPDTILVVEDNTDLRDFITSVLQKKYTVISASDGNKGITQAIEYIPALIISDLMMPGVDGITLTEKIKSDERTSHIPVILLTAKNERTAKLESFKAGADEYLNKPFSIEELHIRVANLITQRKLLAAKYRERITVLPTSSNTMSLDEKFLQKVKAVVEMNMDNFSFDVENLAEEVNLSRAPLSRKLKALTGLSPNEFIKDLRLKKAADLIKNNSDSITQISYQVGFKDQSYFTKCFKKQFGVSPSEYATSDKLEE